jgi:Phage integrase family
VNKKFSPKFEQIKMLPSPTLLNQVASFIQKQRKSTFYCLFLLGKEAGLRVSEAINFNLSLKKKSNLYLIQGKNHKKRVVFIDPSVISELKQNHWKTQPTNRFSFAHFLQKTKKELNISKEIELTPHTLRRYFATYQANSGMPLPVLQKVLGHSSIRTTALYWKNSEEPKEKVISDKWLTGKIPKKPTKPIKNKSKNLLKPPKKENHGEIPPNIQNKPSNSLPEFLTTENKLLQVKVKQLEQAKKAQEQIIINLKNDKKRLEELNNSLNSLNKGLERELIKVQQEKDTLLKMLAGDLKQQQTLTNNKQDNNQQLHQQLIAQIQVLTKN